MTKRKKAFGQVKIQDTPLGDYFGGDRGPGNFNNLVQALDFLHINCGLLSHYGPDYPLVESRELAPPLDSPLVEHGNLPAFSMVILDRPISYQDEGFQFDIMPPEGRPMDPTLAAANRQTFRDRLPRNLLADMENIVGRKALTPLANYPELLRLLLRMDRGHVIARDTDDEFRLAGIFASFPSDLDGEIKRLGQAIGKFTPGDNAMYAANRLFVYRFLMEQTAFPICGERHTSAALFARRLLRRKERFAVKVLGHSDRTLTTLTSEGAVGRLPRVEKVALVRATGCDSQRLEHMTKGGYFVDAKRQVVILRVKYQQHAYHRDNVMEDRACSVLTQEVVHPQTGEILEGLDILGLSQDRLLQLNDIVRGEHQGAIVYSQREIIAATMDVDDRLRFLAAWLQKNRFQIADYSPDHFERIVKVVISFLDDQDLASCFDRHRELVQEIQGLLTELRLAHRMRLLERLVRNRADYEGRKLQHLQILIILNHFLSEEGEQLAADHPRVMRKLLRICQSYLDDPYLKRRALSYEAKTNYDMQMKSEYEKLTLVVQWCKAMVSH